MLNTKSSAKAGPVFTFSLQGRVARPLALRQLRHCLYICHTKAMTTLVEYGTRCLYEDTNFYSVLIVRFAS